MQTDQGIADELRRMNHEFRTLETTHHRLDGELTELQRRHVLTPQEELTKKQLQKEKLAAKDRMAELIRVHREGLQPAAR
ncbi:MAG: YdcH family protein [Nitrospira sp.]